MLGFIQVNHSFVLWHFLIEYAELKFTLSCNFRELIDEVTSQGILPRYCLVVYTAHC